MRAAWLACCFVVACNYSLPRLSVDAAGGSDAPTRMDAHAGDACTTCSTTCGDGFIGSNEECDDGSANTDTPCATPGYANPPAACASCTTSCTIATVVGPYCGDGQCNNGETKATCSEDCAGCGNGILESGEQCDAGSANTNTACATPAYGNPARVCYTCTTGCTLNAVTGPSCGDGVCANGETTTSCPQDCGGCGNAILNSGEQCDDGAANTNTPCPTPAYGNPPNTCSSCTTSCMVKTVVGPYCGDSLCNNGETKLSCPIDCSGCGNGIVDGTEQCDNGAANTNTPCTTPPYHNPPLTCATCTTSCTLNTVEGPYCGDGLCSSGETKTTCPLDCSGCGNGVLEGTEQCDDGALNTNTSCATPAYHNPPFTCTTCTTSCQYHTVLGPYCGDGVCASGETVTTCPNDC